MYSVCSHGGDTVWSIPRNHFIVEFFFSVENTFKNGALDGSYVILILPMGKVKPFSRVASYLGFLCQLLLVATSWV